MRIVALAIAALVVAGCGLRTTTPIAFEVRPDRMDVRFDTAALLGVRWKGHLRNVSKDDVVIASSGIGITRVDAVQCNGKRVEGHKFERADISVASDEFRTLKPGEETEIEVRIVSSEWSPRYTRYELVYSITEPGICKIRFSYHPLSKTGPEWKAISNEVTINVTH
jgi:hypothetical protein